MGRYRDRLQIIADILSVVKGGAKKTHVMYQANLSFTLLKRYLAEVLEAGFVSCDDEDHYSLTRMGRNFLDRFGEYSKRCDRVEQELNNVSNEKMVLENLINESSNRRVNKDLRDKKVK